MLIFNEIKIYINLTQVPPVTLRQFSLVLAVLQSHYFIRLSVTTQEFLPMLSLYLLHQLTYLFKFKHYTAPSPFSVRTTENTGVQLNLFNNKYLTRFIDLYLRYYSLSACDFKLIRGKDQSLTYKERGQVLPGRDKNVQKQPQVYPKEQCFQKHLCEQP